VQLILLITFSLFESECNRVLTGYNMLNWINIYLLFIKVEYILESLQCDLKITVNEFKIHF